MRKTSFLAAVILVALSGAVLAQTSQPAPKRISADMVALPDAGAELKTECPLIDNAVGRKPDDVVGKGKLFSSAKSSQVYTVMGCKEKYGEWFTTAKFGADVVFFELTDGIITKVTLWYKPQVKASVEDTRIKHQSSRVEGVKVKFYGGDFPEHGPAIIDPRAKPRTVTFWIAYTVREGKK